MTFERSELAELIDRHGMTKTEFAGSVDIELFQLLALLQRQYPTRPELQDRISLALGVPLEKIFDDFGYCNPLQVDKPKTTRPRPFSDPTQRRIHNAVRPAKRRKRKSWAEKFAAAMERDKMHESDAKR